MDIDVIHSSLDDNWIQEFNKTDKLYSDFYKDNLYYVNVTILYVNSQNEIDKIKQEPLLLSKPNEIMYEELFGILKRNSIEDAKKFSLLSMLKYNFNIEPSDVQSYLFHHSDANHLSSIRHIDTIVFEKTIAMFHDLNDLILVFQEKTNHHPHNSHNNTKKLVMNGSVSGSGSKKERFKKTIKKRYKE